MHIPIGDYVTEVLDHHGDPIPGAIHLGASLTDEQDLAQSLALSHGSHRWRIMRCVASSDERERWQSKPD